MADLPQQEQQQQQQQQAQQAQDKSKTVSASKQQKNMDKGKTISAQLAFFVPLDQQQQIDKGKTISTSKQQQQQQKKMDKGKSAVGASDDMVPPVSQEATARDLPVANDLPVHTVPSVRVSLWIPVPGEIQFIHRLFQRYFPMGKIMTFESHYGVCAEKNGLHVQTSLLHQDTTSFVRWVTKQQGAEVLFLEMREIPAPAPCDPENAQAALNVANERLILGTRSAPVPIAAAGKATPRSTPIAAAARGPTRATHAGAETSRAAEARAAAAARPAPPARRTHPVLAPALGLPQLSTPLPRRRPGRVLPPAAGLPMLCRQPRRHDTAVKRFQMCVFCGGFATHHDFNNRSIAQPRYQCKKCGGRFTPGAQLRKPRKLTAASFFLFQLGYIFNLFKWN